MIPWSRVQERSPDAGTSGERAAKPSAADHPATAVSRLGGRLLRVAADLVRSASSS